MTDNEIDDVRAIRRDISAEHDHDLRKLVAHYKKLQEELWDSGSFRMAGDSTGHQFARENVASPSQR